MEIQPLLLFQLQYAKALDEGKFSKGDIIILTAFGAGYTWASAVIRW